MQIESIDRQKTQKMHIESIDEPRLNRNIRAGRSSQTLEMDRNLREFGASQGLEMDRNLRKFGPSQALEMDRNLRKFGPSQGLEMDRNLRRCGFRQFFHHSAHFVSGFGQFLSKISHGYTASRELSGGSSSGSKRPAAVFIKSAFFGKSIQLPNA